MTSSTTPVTLTVALKWNGRVFSDEGRLSIKCLDGPSSTTALSLKETVMDLTGVPVGRQKLLCRGLWKGPLRDDVVFDGETLPSSTVDRTLSSNKPLVVTLIGSAETVPEPPVQRTKFVEDLTADELSAQEERRRTEALADAEGMIEAIQLPPGMRDDGGSAAEGEQRRYNRLVTGLPQDQIENLLRTRRRRAAGTGTGTGTDDGGFHPLLGKAVMTMGLELRRAYVNDLAVLPDDGTLVSVLDDGHVQLWRHGEQVRDAMHEGAADGTGVDCVASLPPASFSGSLAEGGGDGDLRQRQGVSFATGGRGCVRLWTADGECVGALPCPTPGISPSSLVSTNVGVVASATFLAASFKVTRKSDPNQFRLLPQDEAGRRRRAEAEAVERMALERLARASRSVFVWDVSHLATGVGPAASVVLEPPGAHGDTGGVADPTVTAPVTALAFTSLDGSASLACGDALGGIRLWRAVRNAGGREGFLWEHSDLLQLRPAHRSEEGEGGMDHPAAAAAAVSSVVCMEPLSRGRLAVATEGVTPTPPSPPPSSPGVDHGTTTTVLSGSTGIRVPTARAVFVVDPVGRQVNVVLDGHKDAVRCMCPLPDGSLVTGGGKFDATLRVWGERQLAGRPVSLRGGGEGDRGDDDATETNVVMAVGDGEEVDRESPQGDVGASADGPPTLTESATELSELGYVFALVVLPDRKPLSRHFALAAAQYNVVKICL